ncbi:MAG TPA: hypothetical protein VLA36_01630 [Longimicrobiales bacterium]|nr:hypothetical protein [Longimicrobiales bacterium]
MRGIALAATLALILTACDSTPDGPGTIDAVVEAPQPLGAVVLEFTGGGVEGFDGQGDTQVYSALVAPVESRYRVILVSPGGGPMRFGIRVVNVREAQPAVTAVSAVSPTNQFVTPAGLQVRLQR